jgi:hypothetical protein
LPERFRSRLGPRLAAVSTTAAAYLRASAAALSTRSAPPALDALEAALEDYDAEFAAMRREGLTRDLPDDAVERVFVLAFALEQLRRNVNDLARCVTEFAQSSSSSFSNMAADAGRAPQ